MSTYFPNSNTMDSPVSSRTYCTFDSQFYTNQFVKDSTPELEELKRTTPPTKPQLSNHNSQTSSYSSGGTDQFTYFASNIPTLPQKIIHNTSNYRNFIPSPNNTNSIHNTEPISITLPPLPLSNENINNSITTDNNNNSNNSENENDKLKKRKYKKHPRRNIVTRISYPVTFAVRSNSYDSLTHYGMDKKKIQFEKLRLFDHIKREFCEPNFNYQPNFGKHNKDIKIDFKSGYFHCELNFATKRTRDFVLEQKKSFEYFGMDIVLNPGLPFSICGKNIHVKNHFPIGIKNITNTSVDNFKSLIILNWKYLEDLNQTSKGIYKQIEINRNKNYFDARINFANPNARKELLKNQKYIDINNKKYMLYELEIIPIKNNHHSQKSIYQRSPLTWTKYDVGKWLRSISMSPYQRHFEENDIDGKFLTQLQYSELSTELGIDKQFIVDKIWIQIEKLRRKYNMKSMNENMKNNNITNDNENDNINNIN